MVFIFLTAANERRLSLEAWVTQKPRVAAKNCSKSDSESESESESRAKYGHRLNDFHVP